MSEHLADSNILKSRRTYGRQEKDQRLSLSINEPTFVEDLYAEEISESTTCVASSSYCNNNNQNGINSEFSLFNDEDIDYYFSFPADSSKQYSSLLSIPEVSSSGSNYLRVRKNLKNRVSNQQYSSEEKSDSILYEENLNSVAEANESKSASNFSNQATQSNNNQDSHLSIINQSKHTKINNVKSNDVCISKLPQNASISQVAKQAEKIPDNGTAFQNPQKSTDPFSLIELVRRFSVSNYQAHAKSKDCESTAKKRSAVKKVSPSKKNSFNKKPSNSRVSIKKSKNVILKSNMMSSQIPDTKINYDIKIGAAKTYSKSVQIGNIRSIDNVERNIALDCVNNTDAFMNVDAKIFKAVQKEHTRSADSDEKSLDMVSSISNLGELSKNGAKTFLKTVQENKECFFNTKRNVKVPKKCVCEKKLIGNKATTKINCQSSSNQGFAKKIQSNDGDKQFYFITENAIQNPALNNNPNINVDSKCLLPTTSLEGTCKVTPLCTRKIVPSADGNHSIQKDNQAASKTNFGDLIIPELSDLSNNISSKNGSEYDMENVLTSDSNKHVYNSTTVYRCKNTITDITDITTDYLSESESEDFDRTEVLENKYTFDIFMANFFDGIHKNCILKFQEFSAKILNATSLAYPSLRNCDMTLRDFCVIPGVTEAYSEFFYWYSFNYSATKPDSNVAYDFPENFEAENLLSLIKDYVFTTSSYLIPEDANASSIISYSEILAVASSQMSKKEFSSLLLVFGDGKSSFKLTEMLAKLGHIALIVMYCESKCRQNSFLIETQEP